MTTQPPRNIYVASSFRNAYFDKVMETLRSWGHYVYDWKHTDGAFSWKQVHPNYQQWGPAELKNALTHPVAKKGYNNDKQAMANCDTTILLLPSGRSAHLEFGWLVGSGRKGWILMPETVEPELLYNLAPIVLSMEELFVEFEKDDKLFSLDWRCCACPMPVACGLLSAKATFVAHGYERGPLCPHCGSSEGFRRKLT